MFIRCFLMIFLSLFLLSCSGHQNQLFDKDVAIKTPANPPMLYSKRVYKIARGDRLSIRFYNYPELSTTSKENQHEDVGVEVGSDGCIVLPLVKRLRVVGMTKGQLQSYLYRKYSPYLQDPTLKVEILNKRIYVLGEVKNPGSLDCIRYQGITPLKAIIQRGGLSKYANPHAIKVLRGDRRNYKLMSIDLTNMASVRARNIVLQPDDIVYVPHNKAKDFNMPINGVSPTLSIINTIFNSVMTYKAVTN